MQGAVTSAQGEDHALRSMFDQSISYPLHISYTDSVFSGGICVLWTGHISSLHYFLTLFGNYLNSFQVLLLASSFMTPLEARNGTNRTSVRMFGKSNMSATVVNEKWDRVKVVCTQPFNKVSKGQGSLNLFI